MELVTVISFIEGQGLPLSPMDRAALEAAWEDITYLEVSIQHGVNHNTLQGYTATALWRKLRTAFGKDIGKKSFRRLITDIIAEASYQTTYKMAASSTNESLPLLGATLPDTSGFIGREQELGKLYKLVEKYSLTMLIGMEGIGKKSLVSQMLCLQRPTQPWEAILWKSLYHSPSIKELEKDLLISAGAGANESLLAKLKLQPALIVLDSIDSISENEIQAFVSLIRRISEETPSRVITISTQPEIDELELLVLRGQATSFNLGGLGVAEAEIILGTSNKEIAKELCISVGGNPLLLKQIAIWGDYTNGVERIDRLTMLDGLIGNFYERVLKRACLSTLEVTLLKHIARATQETSIAKLVTEQPKIAPSLRRLIKMGLAKKSSSQSVVQLDPLFRRKMIEIG